MNTKTSVLEQVKFKISQQLSELCKIVKFRDKFRHLVMIAMVKNKGTIVKNFSCFLHEENTTNNN